jgi:hypothetical protein
MAIERMSRIRNCTPLIMFTTRQKLQMLHYIYVNLHKGRRQCVSSVGWCMRHEDSVYSVMMHEDI